MKFEATIVVTVHAQSVSEAGAMVDDVLHGAHLRDGVAVQSVDLRTPVNSRPVTVPQAGSG
jgi:hypothetical protein